MLWACVWIAYDASIHDALQNIMNIDNMYL